MRKSVCRATLLALFLCVLSVAVATAGEVVNAMPAVPSVGTADIVAGSDAAPTVMPFIPAPAPVAGQPDGTADLAGYPTMQQAYTQEQYAQQLLLQQQIQQQMFQQQLAQQQMMLRQQAMGIPQVNQFPADQVVPAQMPQVIQVQRMPPQQMRQTAVPSADGQLPARSLPPVESLQTLTPMVVPIQPAQPVDPAQFAQPAQLAQPAQRSRESVQVGAPIQIPQPAQILPVLPVLPVGSEAVDAGLEASAVAVQPAQPMPVFGHAATMGRPVAGYDNLFIISPAEVRQALSQGVQLIFLDVRDELVRDIEGNIAGDAHVAFGPADTFALRVSQVIPNAAYPVVVYCSDGVWSSQASAIMARMGYRVYLMGAYPHWLRQ